MSRTQAVRGFQLAGTSVLLGTYAQLAMKWGMARLPAIGRWPVIAAHLPDHMSALVVVGSGLLAYALSMACWLGALGYIPLNRAYPVLGLSYGLVYLGGVILPWYQGRFSLQAIAGVLLIAIGVVLINARREKT